MENLTLNASHLIAGDRLVFTNNENTLEAEVYHENNPLNSWANGFKIYFNGAIIHSSKTIKPLEKKLTELCSKYSLEIAE